jgi:hypothetical protein
MTVADTANRHAGNEIEVFVSICVNDDAAAGAVYGYFRIERDRLQAGTHRLRLAIENRFRFGTGHDAQLTGRPRRSCDFGGGDIVQESAR